MYVKDHMTKNPVTITKDITISKALDMMAKGNFHRLPVVDGNGKLIGLVTEGLIRNSSGAKYTSLSIYELNYLLSRTKVEDIMIQDVKTITADVFLEEAAQKMLQGSINVLPVIDENEKVVGIITEKDIFTTFIDLLGLTKQGTRFVIKCPDHPGVFAKCTKLFADEDANLENLAVYHSERGVEVVVKATGEVSVEKMTDVLVEAGFEVVDVVQTKADGTIQRYPTA